MHALTRATIDVSISIHGRDGHNLGIGGRIGRIGFRTGIPGGRNQNDLAQCERLDGLLQNRVRRTGKAHVDHTDILPGKKIQRRNKRVDISAFIPSVGVEGIHRNHPCTGQQPWRAAGRIADQKRSNGGAVNGTRRIEIAGREFVDLQPRRSKGRMIGVDAGVDDADGNVEVAEFTRHDLPPDKVERRAMRAFADCRLGRLFAAIVVIEVGIATRDQATDLSAGLVQQGARRNSKASRNGPKLGDGAFFENGVALRQKNGEVGLAQCQGDKLARYEERQVDRHRCGGHAAWLLRSGSGAANVIVARSCPVIAIIAAAGATIIVIIIIIIVIVIPVLRQGWAEWAIWHMAGDQGAAKEQKKSAKEKGDVHRIGPVLLC